MQQNRPNEKIYNSIHEAIGNTPMVQLQRIPQSLGVKCRFLVKCEFMNPCGSSKDRTGFYMFEEAEKAGILKPGMNVVEATSGNAGIAFSFMAACKGYKMTITLPERMSNEKITVLKSLGAEVIRTPNGIATFQDGSHYMTAKKIVEERENAVSLDQYINPNNSKVRIISSRKNLIFSICFTFLKFKF